MENESFRIQIFRELINLNKNQIVNFAWICAVRTIPFLGVQNNFEFWNEKERQKYIYAIFYSLDVPFIFDIEIDVTLANDSNNAAIAATEENIGPYSAAKAAFYLVSAYLSDKKLAAANAASRAAITGFTVADKFDINLRNIILNDIESYKNKYGIKQYGSIETIYGEVWKKFQRALKSIDCTYWSRLYYTLFISDFQIDQEGLMRRIGIPNEIRTLGAGAVGHYLEELEKGATRLNEARLIILGDKGSGKTCLARRLIDPDAPMTTEKESTPGVDTTLWKIEDEKINVHIWDFAGHTITHAVHQFFLSERCLYIIVYDGRSEVRNQLEYWLNHMKNFGGDSKAIILVNRRDKHTPQIHINTLREQFQIIKYSCFSIQDDNDELQAFRKYVSEHIKNNPSWNSLQLPSTYFAVKQELENLFEKGKNDKCTEYITKEHFKEIAKKFKIENTDNLLNDLHFLGVSLWYKNMEEFNTLVLNPEWISHGIYRIINWVFENKKHSISLKDFNLVFEFDNVRFPQDKHKYLFNLMKHYQLAYETLEKDCLIIPHLLDRDRPKVLPDFPIGESLMLRYTAEQPLPPDTISRFIVRHNEEIKKEKNHDIVWRLGVVLENGKDTIALVREEDRTISVSVKGNNKTGFISSLRETLNEIFNSYKSDKPELLYRIERFGFIPGEIEKADPLWLSDRKILNHYKKDKPYYDDDTDQFIPMAQIVRNYNIDAKYVILPSRDFKITDDSFEQEISTGNGSHIITAKGKKVKQVLNPDGKLEEFIKKLTPLIKELSMEPRRIRNLEEEIAEIKEQLKSGKPKSSVINTSLNVIKGIMMGVAGNTLTKPILDELEFLISYFK
jgi:GTPase SAR1 family protein